jgi:succinoglycan biosynthesis transport protein ExoP
MSDNAQFQLLRAHVERHVREPAVIIVTSAVARDGKSLTANALAECFARAGRRAALVDATGGALSLAKSPSTALDEGVTFVAAPKRGAALKRKAAADFVNALRASYDYTIVDSGPLLDDDFALSLVGSVDGMLVSVRVGRAPTDEDEMMVRLIEQSKGRIVGVVAVSETEIAEFAKRRTTESADLPSRRAQPASVHAKMQPLAASVRR